MAEQASIHYDRGVKFALRWRTRLGWALGLVWCCSASGYGQQPPSPDSPPAVTSPSPASSGIAASPAPMPSPSAASRAPDPAPTWDDPAPAEELSFGWVLVRTVVVLGLVLAFIYLTLNVGLRRLMGLKGMPAGRATVVSLVERIPLDQKRALFVVKAAGEYLLLGGGDGELSLLTKLDSAEVERLQRDRPLAPLTLSPLLQKLLTRRGGLPPPAA